MQRENDRLAERNEALSRLKKEEIGQREAFKLALGQIRRLVGFWEAHEERTNTAMAALNNKISRLQAMLVHKELLLHDSSSDGAALPAPTKRQILWKLLVLEDERRPPTVLKAVRPHGLGSGATAGGAERLEEIFIEAEKVAGMTPGSLELEEDEAAAVERAQRRQEAMRADVNARMEAMHFARMVSDEVLSSPTAVEMYRAWAEFIKKHVVFGPGAVDPARDLLGVQEPTASAVLGANYRPAAGSGGAGGSGGSGASAKYRSPISKEFFVSLVRTCLQNLYEHFPGLILAGLRKPVVQARGGRVLQQPGGGGGGAATNQQGAARQGTVGSVEVSGADSSTGFFDTFGSKEGDEDDELDVMIGSTFTEATLVPISRIKRKSMADRGPEVRLNNANWQEAARQVSSKIYAYYY